MTERADELRARLRYHDRRGAWRYMPKNPLPVTVPRNLLDALLAELEKERAAAASSRRTDRGEVPRAEFLMFCRDM